MSVTIVKFGGSLSSSPVRDAWLATFLAWGGPLILVPGGGPFAQAVRTAQQQIGFDDKAAHRLALLAMEQFAVVLAARSDGFVLCQSCLAMDEALARGKIPVWLPSGMVLEAPDIPASWDVTSDSLAAWLAGTYGAGRLLLVKSCDPAPPLSAEGLAADRIVDPLFPGFSARSRATISLAGPASLAGAAERLRRGDMPGLAVALSEREAREELVQE